MRLTQAKLLILASDNGEGGWTPLKEADVPAWVKDPDVLARMVGGDMAQNPAEPDGKWYLALRCDEPSLVIEAPAPKLTHSPEAQAAVFHDAEGRN